MHAERASVLPTVPQGPVHTWHTLCAQKESDDAVSCKSVDSFCPIKHSLGLKPFALFNLISHSGARPNIR